MLAAQMGYGMKAAEEVSDDAQYNVSVTQDATGHTAAQYSIANLSTTNAAQQQYIAFLKMQVSQSANSVRHVMYCLPVQQPMIQRQMPM